MRNSYSVTTCPCCGAKIRPHRPRVRRDERYVDAELHRRPNSGPFDPDDRGHYDKAWDAT